MVFKAMAFQRKYRFNWLDHLYYMGKHAVGLRVWFHLMLVLFLPPLGLLIFCVIYFLSVRTYNEVIIRVSICSICALAVVFYANWLLKKHRFTPQRERAYFRRYPQKKDIYFKWSLYYICSGLYLSAGLLGGVFINYRI